MPFLGARRLEPADSALVLVESAAGVPLIFRAQHAGRTAIVVNLDPAASELFFSAWFPVLVHSMATHLAAREESLAAVYRPGDVAPLPGARRNDDNAPHHDAADAAATTTVRAPNGEAMPVVGDTLGPLQHAGYYSIHTDAGDWLIAVSPLSAADTLLDNSGVESTAAPLRRGRSLAHWLTAAAIVLLIVEGLLYHRRKVG